MEITADLRQNTDNRDFLFFAETPVVYHCHHFNLFLDQTINDALGPEAGLELRFTAAREAAHQLIRNVVSKVGAELPAEKLQVARDLFKQMGHGRLQLLADQSGGSARGEYLHYGFTWREKYGQVVRRNDPADAFAMGFAAAAVEIAFQLPRESVDADETKCVAKRDSLCEIELSPGIARDDHREFITQAKALEGFLPIDSRNEEQIATIADGLRGFTAGVSGDDRGLMQAFGVFVTMHLAGYYNRISYDGEQLLLKRNPQLLDVYQALLRESGHVCVFNTFGGILLSPEWEGMIGRPGGDIEEIITYCMGIGRSLGFGHWAIEELIPNERFVMVTPNSYESAYFRARHGFTNRPNSYFVQGSALASMVLAHELNWKGDPQLNQETYNNLFRGGLGWKIEEQKSLSMGHPVTRVVVTRDA